MISLLRGLVLSDMDGVREEGFVSEAVKEKGLILCDMDALR